MALKTSMQGAIEQSITSQDKLWHNEVMAYNYFSYMQIIIDQLTTLQAKLWLNEVIACNNMSYISYMQIIIDQLIILRDKLRHNEVITDYLEAACSQVLLALIVSMLCLTFKIRCLLITVICFQILSSTSRPH